jgi:hypothetical protein
VVGATVGIAEGRNNFGEKKIDFGRNPLQIEILWVSHPIHFFN